VAQGAIEESGNHIAAAHRALDAAGSRVDSIRDSDFGGTRETIRAVIDGTDSSLTAIESGDHASAETSLRQGRDSLNSLVPPIPDACVSPVGSRDTRSSVW
jgi:hypothetical protein